jgi:hypothetical protein
MQLSPYKKWSIVVLNVFPEAISIFVLAVVFELLYRLSVRFGWLSGGMELLLFCGLTLTSAILVVVRLPKARRLWRTINEHDCNQRDERD